MELEEYWRSLSAIEKRNMALSVGVSIKHLGATMNGKRVCSETAALKIIKVMGRKAQTGAYEKLRGRA